MSYNVIWIDTVNDPSNNVANGAAIATFSILADARQYARESSRVIQTTSGGVSVGIYPVVKLIGKGTVELYVNGQQV